MPSINCKLTQSALDLRASPDSGFIDTEGHSSNFIQILDESMCVVREDIADWLQRYLFSSVDAPVIEPPFLLFRLRSGLWLSRLAYKLHISVLQRSTSNSPRAATTVESHEFLKGSASHPSLRNLSRQSLPQFPRALVDCAKLPLGPGDVCSYPENESTSDNSSLSSAQSFSSSPDHGPSRARSGLSATGLSVADRWVARDNVSTFLQWCKELGIPQTVLFETTGLVHRTEEKNVLLTLMELARIASRFGLDDLPELVRMEREIDLLEAKRAHASVLVTKSTLVPNSDTALSGAASTPTTTTTASGTEKDSSAINVRIIRLRSPPANANMQVDQKPSSAPNSGDIVTTQTTVRITGRYSSKQKTVEVQSESGADGSHGSGNGVDFVMDSQGDTMDNAGRDIWCGTSGDSSLSGSICDSALYTSQFGASDAASQTKDRGIDSGVDGGSGDRGQQSRACSTERSATVAQPPDPFVADQGDPDNADDNATFITVRSLRKRVMRNVFLDERPLIQTPPFKVPKTISTIAAYMGSIAETPSPIRVSSRHAFGSTPLTNDCEPSSPDTMETSLSKTPITVLRNLQINSNNSTTPENDVNVSRTSGLNTKTLSGDSLCATPVSKPTRDNSSFVAVDQTYRLNVAATLAFRTDDSIVAEQVEKKVAQCTCCTRLHLQHLEEGRYRLGTRVYYFRRFRNHVMVRVGGGWLTLDAFLERHDPCRRGGNKASTDHTTDGSHLTPIPSALLTVEPLEPKRKLSVTPVPKPSLPVSGSMVDLRRRWSKHSTSSNDSQGSHASVRSTTSTRIERDQPSSTISKLPRSNVIRKDVLSTGARRPSTPTSQNKTKTSSTASTSSVGRRAVTPSANSRNRSASRSTNPPRWR